MRTRVKIRTIVALLLLLLIGGYANAATLHVGSGQTYTTIASAISASSGGDTIIIHEGTYNENHLWPKTGIDSSSRTILQGASGEAKPIINGGATAYGGTWDDSTIFMGYGGSRDHIKLDGLVVKNGGMAAICLYDGGCDDIVITNCEVEMDWGEGDYAGDNSACIYIHPNATNIQIDHNLLTSRNSGVHGIIGFRGDGSWVIENNEFDIDGDGTGSKETHGIFWKHCGTGATQAIVRNNLVHVYGGGNNGGIWIVNNNTLIDNNLVYGTGMGRAGIVIYGSMGVAGGDNCTITNNTVYGAAFNGVKYEDGDGGYNNTFYNNIFSGYTTEFQAFSLWTYATGDTGDHHTTIHHNLYYNSASSTPIKEFRTSYSFANWITHLLSCAFTLGSDTGSCSAVPGWTSSPPSSVEDFEIVSGCANNGGSDGSDMGADISLVGINPGVTTTSSIASTTVFPITGITIQGVTLQ